MYKNKIKRIIDFILALGGLIVLSPVFIILCIWIKLDSKGPILFKQKRVGINKTYFNIYKFRTMYIDTPKDMPTHMLSNPDQYITKSGKFLRKTSLDELPQILNILKGEMAVIGPRPALWNQDDLIAERDRYHANDVRPGLTGWAQINGRDELEIPVKAKLDGEYVEKESFFMDVKCFLGTIGSVLVGDGVVEGGTGEMEQASQVTSAEKLNKEIMIGASVVAGAGTAGLGILGLIIHKFKNKDKKEKKHQGILKKALFILTSFYAVVTAVVNIFRKKNLKIEEKEEREIKQTEIKEKNILITGANSYIGESVEKWLKQTSDSYHVTTLDMLDPHWKEHDFSKYDVVYHVAGIAHADVGNVSEEVKEKYYKVNRDLALEVANIAKDKGVKQFIFMSSMIIYSGCKETFITKETVPQAENFYGDSKLQADLALQELNDATFKVCIVRPPMIYGKGSKGNYPLLVKLATKLPVFPIVKNRRSMLHIDNLCEFIRLMINNEEAGIFFPQNDEYTNTSDMVEMIAKVKGHKIIMIPGVNFMIQLMTKVPGKIGTLANKAFGNSAYDMILSCYDKGNYRVHSLNESIQVSERNGSVDGKKKAIIIASVASMIDQFNRDNIHLLQELGYEVHVACNFENAGTITDERMKKLKKDLDEIDVKYFQVPIPRKLSNIKDMIVAYKKLKKLSEENQYKIMHCHSPIGGVLARLAFNPSRKNGITKIIYTAHGFHFYKGAPLKNWIIFYPIEKICSIITDVLITINHDDYEFARKYMNAKEVKYVPGIGIDLKKFKLKDFDKDTYRKSLGIKNNDFMILSVGELNKNKNHEVVIRAVANLDNSSIHYFVAGQGDLKDYLSSLAKELNIENQIHLLGYRNDIVQLCNCGDLYVLPSIREGLNVSLMEAMASGTPCIAGNIRGNRDLIIDHKNGFLCNPLVDKEFEKCINEIKNSSDLSMLFQSEELKTIQKFSNVSVREYMETIYKEEMNI